jgi:NADPH:quinone reductase-like Zn-dependent oxidoreductase
MTVTMKANRVHRFGGPEVILFEDGPRPTPGTDEILVRIHAAGVGPWDALIRAGHSALPQPLPLTLGADLAGTVEATGARDSPFSTGDEVFGVTNSRFTGAYAQYQCGIESRFILVDVNTEDLKAVADLLDAQPLVVRIGQVLRLGAARQAHEMLERLRPLPVGKVVLDALGGS